MALRSTEERNELARQAAAAGIVVLKNTSSVLPLDPATMTRLAVAGPAAARLCPQGGGSAEVTLPYERSPLQAVSARAPGADVSYEPGCAIPGTVPPLGPSGLRTGNGGVGIEIVYFAVDEDDDRGDPS